MKNNLLISAVISLAACGGSSSSTNTDTPELTTSTSVELLMPLPSATSPEITESDLAVRIKALSDDKFEGRGPGTPAGENSAQWIADEMKRIGVKPGNAGSYLQTVEMVEQTVDISKSGIEIISAKSGLGGSPELLSPYLGEAAVIWTKRQTEGEIVVDPSDMVFVGYGVNAPEYGWNDYDGLDVTGKTVIMLVNDPGYANPDGDLFKGKAMTYYGRWTYKYEEAARQGAAAAFIVHETAPASYGWDVVSSSWSGAQADLVRKDAGASRIAMEGWLHRDMAEHLFELNELDFEALKTAAATPGFKAVPMPNTKLSGSIIQTVEKGQSSNVVGIVEGTQRPDEFMLYTAHWDHIGVKPGAGDTIYNGAVDNATGTAAILEIAEALVADPPERSALFLAVTLEESGLLGSAYYAENPIAPLQKTVAGINIDAMLPTGRSRDMVVVGYGASELENLLSYVLIDQDRNIVPDPTPEAGYFYRSDHISLAKKGVPMLYADGGVDLRDGGIAAGIEFSDGYRRERYHAPGDEWSDDWDLSGMVEDVAALHAVGLHILNSNDWPDWYEGREFKAIRDASLAEVN